MALKIEQGIEHSEQEIKDFDELLTEAELLQKVWLREIASHPIAQKQIKKVKDAIRENPQRARETLKDCDNYVKEQMERIINGL